MAEELRAAFAEVDVREAGVRPAARRLRRRRGRRPDDHGLAQATPSKYLKRHNEPAGERAVRALRHRRVADRGRRRRRPGHARSPRTPGWSRSRATPDKLSRKERYALPSHYLGDILKVCAPARPRSAAVFAGSLDLTTMNLFEKLFVLLVVGATPGDGRHCEFIRDRRDKTHPLPRGQGAM